MKATAIALGLALAALASTTLAQPPFGQGPNVSRATEFIILGTASGPNSEADRAQPANALLAGGQLYLVDAGDGAVAQMAKAGLRIGAVRGVFLSHLHFDHIGGMLAVIGLRAQLGTPGMLTIYGPPGTQELVDGLLMAAGPGLRAGWGFPGQGWEADVVAVELSHGDTVTLDGLDVTVVENTHFSVPAGDDSPPSAVSLSFRFDTTDRSVVYSGDTGRSDALVELARGADLLISEMIDDELALAAMRPPGAPPPPADRQPTVLEWHMDEHHMTPRQVGELANAAGVGSSPTSRRHRLGPSRLRPISTRSPNITRVTPSSGQISGDTSSACGPFGQSQARGQPGIDRPAASTSSQSARAAAVCAAITRRTSPIGCTRPCTGTSRSTSMLR